MRLLALSSLFLLTIQTLLSGDLRAGPNGGLPEDTARVNALVRRSRSFISTNPDSLGFFAREAKEMAERLRYRRGIADATDLLGDYYMDKDDFATSIRLYQEAITVFDSLRLLPDEGWLMLKTAQVYKDLAGDNGVEKFIDQGIGYAQTGYRLYAQAKDTGGMILALNEAGILYRDKSKIPGRRSYFDTAFTAYKDAVRLNAPTGAGMKYMSKIYGNISQVYMEYKNDPRGALVWVARAEKLNLANNRRMSLTYNYNNFAQAYMQLGQIDSSLYYARKMLALSHEIKVPDRDYDAYLQLYSTFAAAHRSDSALHYHILASNLNDSLTNIAKTKVVADLQAKYEDAKKEMSIEKLHAETSAKSQEIRYLSVVAVGLLLVLAGFAYLIHRLRQQKRQIAEQSGKLETMLRELHHRVKNNLQIVSSLLSLQQYRLDDPGAKGILLESQQRVQAMSLIHQRLYKEDIVSTVNIKNYLEDLSESLMASYGWDRDSLDLQIVVVREKMDIDQALPIGLIVNELVTNAFKYAYAGVSRPALYIGLEQGSKDIVLRVKDNGVGLSQEKWRQARGSFGAQLIKALCKQLRARQEMEAEGGTEFTFTIPKSAA